MIIWNEQFNTGSDAIDQQHQMLIHNINQLECLLTETNPTRETCDFLAQLIDFFESYVKEHFRFEEDCMEKHRCPVHAANRQAHETFIAFFLQFKEDSQHQGFRPDVVRKLHRTMDLWIQEHILRVDIQLKPCLKSGN